MDYKRYKVWQLADEVARAVYRVTSSFPRSEVFALSAQMRRAALSVPGNIVEGSARRHQREFLQFLYVASSSLAELRYYIDFAETVGYVKNGAHKKLNEMCQETAKVLQGLIGRLERDLKADGRQLAANS